MSQTVPLPAFDDTVREAVLADWRVAVGAAVAAGDPLCDVTVDKVTLVVDAPAAGTVLARIAEEGDVLAVGDPLAILGEAGAAVDPQALPASAHAKADPAPCPAAAALDASEFDLIDGPPEPLDAMRAVVARRMAESKLTAPCFYLTTAVDMTACAALRKTLKADGVRATYNDMIIRAAGLALRKYPRVASVYRDGAYLPRDHMNVGFAVAVELEGLVVPVVRDADRKSLAEVAAAAKALIEKARNNRLTPADYAEGVFSVSNLGGFEVDQFTAIVNPGESAILALGKTIDTPVVVKKEITVRPVMKITLSSDHRTVDGILAARFNGYLKQLLENPESLL